MAFESGTLVFIDPTGGGALTDANNALSLDGTTVQLGGIQIKDTTIDQDSFELEITDGLDRFALGNGVFRVDRVAAPNSTQILQDDSSLFLSSIGADGNNGIAMESLAGVEQLALSMTYSDFEYLQTVDATDFEEYYFDPVGGGFTQINMDPTLYLLQVDDGAVDNTVMRTEPGTHEIVCSVGASTGTHTFTDIRSTTPITGIQEIAAAPSAVANLGQVYVLTDEVLYYKDASNNVFDLTATGSPGGLTGDIQYNNAGAFGGFGDWDGSLLTVGGNIDANRFEHGSGNHIDFSSGWIFTGSSLSIGKFSVSGLSSALLVGGLTHPTGADRVLVLNNGSMGNALANAVQLGSQDLSAGNTMLAIQTEGTPIGAGTPAQDTTIAIEVNGTTYYLHASTTPT